MKKFLLTIALVLLCGATMAQNVVTTIDTDHVYTLECKSGAAHSTTRFIGVTATGVIDGHSAKAAFVTFEAGDAENSYYIKVDGKFINYDGSKLSASEEKLTAWVLGTVGQTVTFKYPNATKYLNNNGTACDDGTITNLQANNHPSGPTADNACSTWEMKEVDMDEYINNWKSKTLQTCGYVGGYAAGLADEIEAIETYEQLVEFEKADKARKEISTDEFYRIVAVAPKAANGNTDYKTLAFNGEGNLVTTPANNSNVNQIFKFEDAGEGKFYLKNLNADGYLNKIAAGNYRSAIVAQSSACKLDLTHYGNAQWKLHNSESNDSRHCLFAENHATEAVPYACSGWENGANSASAWYIIPATEVEITVNEYASVYLPFAVKVEGATAYAVTATSETSATLTEMADIAANEGAILAGNGVATLSFKNEATTDWSTNKLEGTTYTTNVAEDAYVLFNGENGIGFYLADKNQAEGTAFKNWANKAYLPMPAGAEGIKSFSFRFEGEGTTGVEEVKTENGEAKTIYDLTGRRVEAITAPGIYIVNGKKTLVK